MPEQLGGLSTPRSAAEIVGGDGHDVLAGKARVVNRDGIDVSQQFIRGAQAVGELARFGGVKVAILQERSPSCGTTQIYDGTFSGQLRSGQGVTGARLALLGLVVRPQESINRPGTAAVPGLFHMRRSAVESYLCYGS